MGLGCGGQFLARDDSILWANIFVCAGFSAWVGSHLAYFPLWGVCVGRPALGEAYGEVLKEHPLKRRLYSADGCTLIRTPFVLCTANLIARFAKTRQVFNVGEDAKRRGMAAGEMASALDEALRSNGWFVTGRVDASLFSEDFFFSDPQVTRVTNDGRIFLRYRIGPQSREIPQDNRRSNFHREYDNQDG